MCYSYSACSGISAKVTGIMPTAAYIYSRHILTVNCCLGHMAWLVIIVTSIFLGKGIAAAKKVKAFADILHKLIKCIFSNKKRCTGNIPRKDFVHPLILNSTKISDISILTRDFISAKVSSFPFKH